MRRITIAAMISWTLAAGCAAGTGPDDELVGESAAALSQKKEAKRLFEEETFGGNGRTCATCHSAETGTLSPEDVQAIFAEDPNDPLFSHDGSDDFQGNGTSRILADATILVRIPLPPNVTLANDPTATSVVVRRGIPTTLNTPALDPVLMYDGRAPDLEAQALGAVHDHTQATREPTGEELSLIAEHQTRNAFFSSPKLKKFFKHGTPPALPEGDTDAEKRGRLFFEDFDIGAQLNQASSRKGLCAICHSGPMLNESNGFNPLPVPPFHVPKGTRFQSVLVSELNAANNPVYDFVIHNPDGSTTVMQSPDPGISLINGNFTPFPFGQFSNFKIPSLWGISKTAPYFHDSSAKTLEALMDHYTTFFAIATDVNIDGDPPLVLTPQDKADVIAFLKLL